MNERAQFVNIEWQAYFRLLSCTKNPELRIKFANKCFELAEELEKLESE